MFNHNFLPQLELQQLNEPTGRRYKTPEGNYYKSVTTWLGSLNHETIDAWRKAVGDKHADMVSKRATDRGTKLHGNIEKFLLNEEVSFVPYDYLNKSLFNQVKEELVNIDNILLLESPLYSDRLKLAGTVDCVAEWKGSLAVIDFKSSTNPKDREQIENYWLQTCIYSLMVEERYGIKADKLVVLIGNEYTQVSVYEDSRKNWVVKLGSKLKESGHL